MKVLIVVDMQNDFINGSLGTKEAVAIVPNVKKKIEEYRANDDAIVFTRDTHFADYLDTNEGKHLPLEHCVENTHGRQIKDELMEAAGHPWIIDKYTFGYKFWDSMLAKRSDSDGWEWLKLREVSEIELVGLCTDICVVSNALIIKALFPEAQITVDASCCAGVTPETHRAALITMKMCQINVIGE